MVAGLEKENLLHRGVYLPVWHKTMRWKRMGAWLIDSCMDGFSTNTKLKLHGGTQMFEPRYQDIVNSYPCDQGVYGSMHGEALEAAKEYSQIADKKEIDEISEISSKLADVVNGHDPKMVAKALYMGLCNKHRTLQASAIKALLELLKLYKDTDYDLRNRAAVVAAHVISQVVEDESLYIPLI